MERGWIKILRYNHLDTHFQLSMRHNQRVHFVSFGLDKSFRIALELFPPRATFRAILDVQQFIERTASLD